MENMLCEVGGFPDSSHFRRAPLHGWRMEKEQWSGSHSRGAFVAGPSLVVQPRPLACCNGCCPSQEMPTALHACTLMPGASVSVLILPPTVAAKWAPGRMQREAIHVAETSHWRPLSHAVSARVAAAMYSGDPLFGCSGRGRDRIPEWQLAVLVGGHWLPATSCQDHVARREAMGWAKSVH